MSYTPGGGGAAVDPAVTAILADSPALLMPFDLPAFDRSPTGLEPTLGGISSDSAGPAGKRRAAKWPASGTINWMLPDNAIWDSTAMTIEAWVKMPATASRRPIFAIDDGGANRKIALAMLADGSIQATPNLAINQTSVTTGLDDGNWHHVAWAFNGSTYLFVIDGVQDSVGTSGTNLANTAIAAGIGYWQAAGETFHTGSMALLAIFTSKLTLGQIQAHRSAAL
jgi:hypothetical protein